MLSRHNNSRFAMFRPNNQPIDLPHCIVKYAMTFELEYDVQILHTRAFDNAQDIQSSQIIQGTILSSFCRYTHVTKRSLDKNKNVFTVVTEQTKRGSSSHDLGLVHLDDATAF